MTPTILREVAKIEDAEAVARLLESVPDSGSVSDLIECREPFVAQVWDPKTSHDYWVASDGKNLFCYAVAGLTHQQALAIRAQWVATREQHAVPEFKAETLARWIAVVTDGHVPLVH